VSDNEYFRKYMLKRYHQRRDELINRLGGACLSCGSKQDLEFDHIDPESKLFSFGKKGSSVALSKLLEEIDKCQLLCIPCHRIKSSNEPRAPHPNRKLTDVAVRDIRLKRLPQRGYSALYGVSRPSIKLIQRGLTYKDIPG
jgi:5-methylcytosine-specific restriction endonuclease McrA